MSSSFNNNFDSENRLGRFDQIQLLTTKGVTYLSGPPGVTPSPHGVWSVAAIIGDTVLAVQNSVVIRIPITDVQKIGEYDINKITSLLGGVLNGKEERSSKRNTN